MDMSFAIILSIRLKCVPLLLENLRRFASIFTIDKLLTKAKFDTILMWYDGDDRSEKQLLFSSVNSCWSLNPVNTDLNWTLFLYAPHIFGSISRCGD